MVSNQTARPSGSAISYVSRRLVASELERKWKRGRRRISYLSRRSPAPAGRRRIGHQLSVIDFPRNTRSQPRSACRVKNNLTTAEKTVCLPNIFRGRDKLRIGAGFGKYAQSSQRDKSNKECASHPPQFAQPCQIVRHTNKPPMNDVRSVLCQPDYLALNCCANGCVEFIQLSSGLWTYFDSVGHCTWCGSHALNSPAKS